MAIDPMPLGNITAELMQELEEYGDNVELLDALVVVEVMTDDGVTIIHQKCTSPRDVVFAGFVAFLHASIATGQFDPDTEDEDG